MESVALDTLWVLMCSFLVFFMNTGFGCLEAGFCRSKNAVNIFAKNFVVFAIASLSFWAVGFGLMFGNGTSLVGLEGWFLSTTATAEGAFSSLDWASIPLVVKFFFQLAFAATAATIVSGCVAERIKFGAFLAFSFFIVAVVYPISGHWIWGGGWLQSLGMLDFAGSTVVHSVGGWAGLAGVMLLGPRLGKYRKDGRVNPIPGHNMALVFIGGMILWLGWFGFNPGSTMAIAAGGAATTVGHVVVVTNLACAAGLIAATALAHMKLGTPDFSMTVNGALAGLVSITAPCAFVTPFAAVCIGAVGGILAVYGVLLFDRLRLDDPVGALSVHLIGGIWGTLAVGLFCTTLAPGGATANGLLYGGGWSLLGAQALGVLTVAVFSFTASYAAWYCLRAAVGIRVSAAVEAEGLDIHEMGMEAYPDERPIDVQKVLRESNLGAYEARLSAEVQLDSMSARYRNHEGEAASYGIKLHNIEADEFLARWRELCGNQEASSKVFRDIYARFTTVQGNLMMFRGGDGIEIQQKLQALASTIVTDAYAELVKIGGTAIPSSAKQSNGNSGKGLSV